MSECPAGCGARVRWVTMQSGKLNPVEPDASEDAGNIVIQHGVGRQLGATEAAKARDDGYALYLSHLAICPKAKEQQLDRTAEDIMRIVERDGRTFGVVDGGAS